MEPGKASVYRRTEPLADFLKEALREEPRHHHYAQNPLESTRTAEHDGHQITIRTTYEILVDGHPLVTHVFVRKDGKLHCHPLPNHVFPSALDMVKRIIDLYPDQFSAKDPEADHGGHS